MRTTFYSGTTALISRAVRLALVGLLIATSAPSVLAQDKVGSTAAAFLGIGIGARATAMGGAQVADVQGPSALYWNPSAIAMQRGSAAQFTNANWFLDTQFQHVGLVFDGGSLGSFGVSLFALNYGDEAVTAIEQCGPDNPVCETGELWNALDLALGLTYARRLTDRFAFGATAKIVSQSIWNESATGAALDLGVVYDTGFRGLTIGMSMANFGTDMQLSGPDLRRAFDPEPDQNGNNDRLAVNYEVGNWPMPLLFRVGVAMDAFNQSGQRIRLSIDGNAPADDAQNASFGAEYGFRDFFFARGGWRQAFGSEGADGWTLGFGLRYALNSRFAGYFDYAFQDHDVFGTPQMFSAGVTF
ncbi:MAG: PorV/PorQ family protein [Bacteroidota bacterium]